MHPKYRRATLHVPHHTSLHKRLVAEFVYRMTSIPVEEKIALLLCVNSSEWVAFLDRAEKLLSEALQLHASYTADSFYERAQLIAFVKKYRGIKPSTQSLDPEHTARATWLEAEQRCKDATSRLADGIGAESEMLLVKARHYIWTVLGDEPDLEQVYASCDFSSGASVGVHGDLTHVVRKYTEEVWTVTLGALPHALAALYRSRYSREHPNFSELNGLSMDEVRGKLRVVPGNKLSFVPKTMATHRAIAVEPLLNSYVQSGVDAVMRSLLLKRAHCDLRDQTRNQRLAREGSISGLLATIDLSSASDTISWGLVRRLLPYGWWRLLSSLRSPKSLDAKSDTWVELNKFSSMGNNFTFPLQTLIFRALARACGTSTLCVYGDDIIVDANCAPSLIDLLDRVGMQVNRKKTFYTGPFRESCGSDWWSGVGVRPAFCVNPWNDVRNIAAFHNAASRLWPSSWQSLLIELRSWLGSVFVRPTTDSDGGAFNVPIDVFMGSQFSCWDRKAQHWTWLEHQPRPVRDKRKYGPNGDWAQWLASLKNGKHPELAHRRMTTNAVRRVGGWDLPRIHLGWLSASERGNPPSNRLRVKGELQSF